jgi:glucose-6-phosphate isomerase
MAVEGKSSQQARELLPHRIMPGDRPSNILLLDALTPENLGMLLTMYEHSVFVESVIWDINAFDQWGVELGKVLAGNIEPALRGGKGAAAHGIVGLDGLVSHIRKILRA